MDSLIAAVVNWNLSKGSGMKGVLHMTQEAAQAGAELIVLPEFVVLELLREIPSVPEEQTAIALAEHAMRWTEAFSNLARSTGAVIVAGSIFEETHGGIRNVAPVCFPDGLVRRVEKNRMTGYEAEVWGLTPGDSLLAFEGPPLGVAICYDVEFPEAVRAMAEAGAKVVCVPSFTETRQGFQRVRWCCQARAIENQVFVLQASLVGTLKKEPVPEALGASSILCPSHEPFPESAILAETEWNGHGFVLAELDFRMLEKCRKMGDVRNWHDRKPYPWRVRKGTI
jgi:predicted amidohydrolase